MMSKDRTGLLAIWREGWHQAHADLVPRGALRFRTLSCFAIWLTEAPDAIHVVRWKSAIAGFFGLHGAELTRFYVSEQLRGSGIAGRMLAHAETMLSGFGGETAWLLCTVGNFRAERFHVRDGWSPIKTETDALWVPKGETAVSSVPTRRFEKRVL